MINTHVINIAKPLRTWRCNQLYNGATRYTTIIAIIIRVEKGCNRKKKSIIAAISRICTHSLCIKFLVTIDIKNQIKNIKCKRLSISRLGFFFHPTLDNLILSILYHLITQNSKRWYTNSYTYNNIKCSKQSTNIITWSKISISHSCNRDNRKVKRLYPCPVFKSMKDKCTKWHPEKQ